VKLTNKYNLPSPIYEAIRRDSYNAGDCDISTTRLISPPRIVALGKKYADQVEEDVSERIWSLFGQVTHAILERAGSRENSEKRYFAEMDGWKISGAVDFLDDTTIFDFKTTSVWSVIFDSRRKEWTEQGNVNRWLAHKNGRESSALQNIVLLRDWSKNKVGEKKYPEVQVVTIDLDVWPIQQAENFIKERVHLHREAQKMPDEALPLCTPEERWSSRTGEQIRCKSYCSVKNFCSFYKSVVNARA
jgi:hypothetical protein